MMTPLQHWFALLTVVAPLLPVVTGHGRLMEPPSRSSMWRQGYASPVNYADNQLFCGGFKHQWEDQAGRCGVCGDPYDGPRDHEPGGKYYTGIITRTYTAGEVIDVHVQLTAFHYGYFEFRLCQLDYRNQTVGQDCFDQHQLKVVTPSDSEISTRYKLPDDSSITMVRLQVRLPPHLTCDQCVFQWKYHAANSWGSAPSGRSCIGCGPQEEFFGCADVTIHPPRGAESSSKRTESKSVSKSRSDSAVNRVLKTVSLQQSEYSVEDEEPSVQQDDWPGPQWDVARAPWYGPQNEQLTPPEPKSMAALRDMKAVLVGKCHATGAWAGQASMDDWCEVNCDRGHCPETHCACGEGKGGGGGGKGRGSAGTSSRTGGSYQPEPLPKVTPIQRWSPLGKTGSASGDKGADSAKTDKRALPYRIVTQQSLPWVPDPKAGSPRQTYTPLSQRTYLRSRSKDRPAYGQGTRGTNKGPQKGPYWGDRQNKPNYWGIGGGPQDKPNNWGSSNGPQDKPNNWGNSHWPQDNWGNNYGPQNKPNNWGYNNGPKDKPNNWGNNQGPQDKPFSPWTDPGAAARTGYRPPPRSKPLRRGEGVDDILEYSQNAFHSLKDQAEAAYRTVMGKDRKKLRPGLFDGYKTFGAPHLPMDSMSWAQFNLDRPLYKADGFGLNGHSSRKSARPFSAWKPQPKSGFSSYPSTKQRPYFPGVDPYSRPKPSFGYGFGGPDKLRVDDRLIKQAQFVDGTPGGAGGHRRPEPKRVSPLDTERGELGENCEAAGAWKGQIPMTKWCQGNCPLGNCPPTHCKCTY